MLILSILYMTITDAIDSTAAAAMGVIAIYQLRRLFRMVCSACFKNFFRTSNRYAECIAGTV